MSAIVPEVVAPEDWNAARAAATAALPDMAADGGLPAVLLPYQAEAVRRLEDPATRVLVVEKSRRVGLTWGLAAYAVLRAGRARDAGGMDAMYISYSQEMTREFIDACAMWARAFAVAATAAEETLFPDADAEGDRAIQAFRIRFASGFEILALSSAPRSLRGKQGVVIVDEAAFVDSLPELLKAALAFLMWGGQVVVCSTHDGADNPFNGLVQDILAGRSRYAHMRVDLDRALAEGLYRRICLVTGRDWSAEAEAAWRAELVAFYGDGADEELFCVPALGSGAWLPAPLIEARMTESTPVLRLDLPADFLHRSPNERALLLVEFMFDLRRALKALDPRPRYAFGFDFARVADLTVGVLLAIEPGLRRRQALVFELRGVPGEEQKKIAGLVLDAVRARLVGAAFDATGMGWTVAEDLGRRFGLREGEGSGLVLAVKFTEEWYRLQMPPLKAAFEDDGIAIAADEAHLADLRSVKLVRGIPRVPPQNTGGRDGAKGMRRHGDYAIALALAHFASRERWSEYGYRAAGGADAGAAFDGMPDLSAPVRPWWRPALGARLGGRIV